MRRERSDGEYGAGEGSAVGVAGSVAVGPWADSGASVVNRQGRLWALRWGPVGSLGGGCGWNVGGPMFRIFSDV